MRRCMRGGTSSATNSMPTLGAARLNVFADRPSELEATGPQLEAHRKLVREEIALFGSRHFAHHDFLLAISDNLSGIGLEHHQSSEDAVGLGYFSDGPARHLGATCWRTNSSIRGTASFCRPADLGRRV